MNDANSAPANRQLTASWCNNSFDNYPIPIDESFTWNELCDCWESAAPIARRGIDKKYSTPALCLGLFKDNPDPKEHRRRVKLNGQWWDWFGFDADKSEVPYLQMKEKLDALGCPYCLHSTTQSTQERNRYRAFLLTDRRILADELPRVWASFNAMFGGVFDPSARDVSRLFYVPAQWDTDHVALDIRRDGTPICVDEVVATYTVAVMDEAALGIPDEELPETVHYVAAIRRLLLAKDRVVDPLIVTDLDLSPFVRARMMSDYIGAAEGGRFYRFMVQFACFALTCGYAVTDREVEEIGLKMSRRVNPGKPRPNALHEAQNALRFAGSSIGDETVRIFARSPWADDGKDAAEQIVVHGVDADCGDGKSFGRLRDIALSGGRWIFCTDKIESIQERKDEFRLHNPSQAMGFEIMDAHSQKGVGATVIGQINAAHLRLGLLPTDRPVLFFITHAAAVLMDWSQWQGFNITFDENMDVLQTYGFVLANNAELVKRAFTIRGEEEDRYLLGLSEWGQQFVQHEADDEFDQHYWPLVAHAARQWSKVWVEKKGWDQPASDELRFWTIITPEFLRPFSEVWVMGDELSRSVLRHVWEFNGVKWKWHDLPATRARAVPLSERLRLHHFVDLDDASFSRFDGKGDMPLLQVCEYLIRHGLPPFIWTVNERFLGRLERHLEDRGLAMPGEHLTPRATGSNHYLHIHCAVWLAAMKVATAESHVVLQACGMTMGELIRAREHHAMNQFIMRTALRDYADTEPVDVYVFSKRQAEYLHSRYGGTMTHIEGVVADLNKRKGGQAEGRASEDSHRADTGTA